MGAAGPAVGREGAGQRGRRGEIVGINSDAGNRALQVAMLVPIIACLLGFANSFRMMRLPDFKPSAAAEGVLGG